MDIKWRPSLKDVILFKVILSLTLVAVYFVPAPWHIPVGAAANLLWVWRL